MALKRFDILMPGDYFCDVVFTGLPVFPALGTEIFSRDLTVVPGGVLNTVVALRRLGVNIGWIGALGNDFFSRFILEQAQAEGLDTSLLVRKDQPMRRVTISLSYPADRAFVSYVDPALDAVDILMDQIDKVSFSHLHIGSLELEGCMPDLIRICHERGASVSMDCQHRSDTLESPPVREILALLDIFMPNADEARQLTGASSLDDAAAVLSELVSYLVIKDGANGAHAWRNGIHDYAPALDLTPVDTTGAGDVFNAGFLSAHLAGMDTPACLRRGNICGGLSTQGYGGCTAAPTLAEVEKAVIEYEHQQEK
jgi:hypothetical protein